MSEDKNEPVENDPAPEAKKPKNPVQKKNPANPFNKKNNHFVSPKSGNPGAKGGGFKGGGVKKGK